MSNQDSLLDNLLESLTGGVEKVAEEQVETPAEEVVEAPEADMTKVAEDARAAGRFIAEGFWERFTEKLAMSGMVPAAGGGNEPRSRMQEIAKSIGKMKGEDMVPGDDTSIRAQEAGALSGAEGVVNPANYTPKSQG